MNSVPIEAAIGQQIARFRQARELSLTQLGQAVGRYLGKPWSRQAVHQAERGGRAFTAAELAALALALATSVPAPAAPRGGGGPRWAPPPPRDPETSDLGPQICPIGWRFSDWNMSSVRPEAQ